MTTQDNIPARSLPMLRGAVIFLAVVASIVLLHFGAPILVPLGIALFLIALAWPVKEWLDRRLPESLSYLGSLIALSLVVAVLVTAFWLSAIEILNHADNYRDTFNSLVHDARQELTEKGVDTKGKVSLEDLKPGFGALALQFQALLVLLALVIAYVLLAIPEAARWKKKLRLAFGEETSKRILDTMTTLSRSFQTYIVAVMISGSINAVLIGSAAFLLGLDFPFSWAVLSFVMTFIPTLGPFTVTLLMTLFAAVQFEGGLMTLAVFCAASAAHVLTTNIIDPRLQGGMLSISPVVVLFSLTFWGLLWGVPGALLATPMTQALIITCGNFKESAWIARLLTQSRG